MLKVGWTLEWIKGFAEKGQTVGVCVFDTEKEIKKDPADAGGNKVQKGEMQWPQLIAKAKAHPDFMAEVSGKGVTAAKLDQAFKDVQETPVGAPPKTPDAAAVRAAMSKHLSANELYSGMGATIQETGALGGREVALDNNGTNFQLKADNFRAVSIGGVTKEEVNALAKTLNKPEPFPGIGPATP